MRSGRVTHKESAECTGKSSSGDQESDAVMLFISFVPHAQIERSSREEPGFCDAQEEAGDEESGETLGEAHKGTNDTPREGHGRKPKSRRCDFEDDVTWDLDQDVTNKVDGQCGEVLVSGLHFEWL